MNKLFYTRLALTNIRNNRKTYFPYLLTCTITVAMLYMIVSLAHNDGLSSVFGAQTVTSLLLFAADITALFSAIFVFYTNSFLMKRRKKELGLYQILGMEKRHISRVIGLETLFIALASLIAGLLIGILLDKLLFLALLGMFDVEIPLGFQVSGDALLKTVILFGITHFLIFLYSLRQIHFSKPIELLYGANIGEREPRAKIWLAILGVLLTGAGYYLTVTTKSPIAVLGLFFLAVILIIFGTYLLFTAGSISLLKLLRKNKRYYYKTQHFISISGMLYRMKQNAVGLANICVLSTAVLVMISTTLSLWIGTEDVIRTAYPRDAVVTAYDSTDIQPICEQTDALLSEHGLRKEEPIQFTFLAFSALHTGEDTMSTDLAFSTLRTGEDTMSTDSSQTNLSFDQLCTLYFVSLDQYNKAANEHEKLNDSEILIYSAAQKYSSDTLRVLGETFTVKQHLSQFPSDKTLITTAISNDYIIVTSDFKVIEQLYEAQKEVYGKNASGIQTRYGFNISGGSDEEKRSFFDAWRKTLPDSCSTSLSQISARSSYLSLYGGLFFIGVFLGFLFLMATILIIYYKQVSEGYSDRERFLIMQKVGLDQSESRKAIHSQILTVFFLPLIGAGVHIAFLFPALSKMLAILNLTNITPFALCTAGCFLLFAVTYIIIYALTARAYSAIVSK